MRFSGFSLYEAALSACRNADLSVYTSGMKDSSRKFLGSMLPMSQAGTDGIDLRSVKDYENVPK